MNKIALIVAVLALLVGAFGVVSPAAKEQVLGALSSPNVQSYLNVYGAFSQGGGSKEVAPVASAYTLTFDDLNANNVITFVASTTMPALTLNLPATTTFPLAQNSGSYRSWVIENPFLGAATTTTIAAGTGVDLQEPDGQNVVVGINNYAWLTCFRLVNSDISCRVDETIPAD